MSDKMMKTDETEADIIQAASESHVTRMMTYEEHGPDFVKLKDPGLHAKWVRKTDDRINYHQGLGYRVAKPSDVDIHRGTVTTEKTIIRRDTILMVCPRELVEDRNDRRDHEGKAQERLLNKEHDEKYGIEKDSAHGQQKGSRFVGMS
jgi:hypothetical protein